MVVARCSGQAGWRAEAETQLVELDPGLPLPSQIQVTRILDAEHTQEHHASHITVLQHPGNKLVFSPFISLSLSHTHTIAFFPVEHTDVSLGSDFHCT